MNMDTQINIYILCVLYDYNRTILSCAENISIIAHSLPFLFPLLVVYYSLCVFVCVVCRCSMQKIVQTFRGKGNNALCKHIQCVQYKMHEYTQMQFMLCFL